MAVTLDDLKAHCNVTFDTDDALLTRKLAVATAHVENVLGGTLDETFPAAEFPDGVPAPVVEAILQIAAHLYENREVAIVGVTVQEIPLGAHDLLSPYRSWSFT